MQKKKLQECENKIRQEYWDEHQGGWIRFLKDGLITEVPVSAPSAGRRRVTSHLPSTSLWLGQHASRLTAQHDANEESQSREDEGECEGPGVAVPFHREWAGWCRSDIQTPSSSDTHTVSHIAPDTSGVCSTHTSCVHTRLSLWSSAAIQRCSAILLRRVINYSSRISALVQSWAW